MSTVKAVKAPFETIPHRAIVKAGEVGKVFELSKEDIEELNSRPDGPYVEVLEKPKKAPKPTKVRQSRAIYEEEK